MYLRDFYKSNNYRFRSYWGSIFFGNDPIIIIQTKKNSFFDNLELNEEDLMSINKNNEPS